MPKRNVTCDIRLGKLERFARRPPGSPRRWSLVIVNEGFSNRGTRGSKNNFLGVGLSAMAKKCEHERVTSTCSVCRPESVYNAYKYKAEKQRHLIFSLTLREFEETVRQPCHYCGETNNPRGLDRVDNRAGYTVRNCVPSCGPCNMLKKDLDLHSFLILVQKIAAHQKKLLEQKAAKRPTAPSQPEAAAPAPQLLRPHFQDPSLSPEARRFLDGI
jgi:hypothetical protein